VSDNGPGISAARKDELFKPFFTTKAAGTGKELAARALQ
jgi:C4-dicarboxylate-specific signal transduction histidine kinase